MNERTSWVKREPSWAIEDDFVREDFVREKRALDLAKGFWNFCGGRGIKGMESDKVK